MSKLIFIAPYINSAIQRDIDILDKEYELSLFICLWMNKMKTTIGFIRQFYFLLKNIKNSTAIVIEFGGYWSVLPSVLGKLFNTPVFIVLRGTDCASIPSLKYGNLRNFFLKNACHLSYYYCSALLPVSKSLIYTENRFHGNSNEIFQGIKAHFPILKFKYKVIPNGLYVENWSMDKSIKRNKNSFIAVFSKSQFSLKGGDLICETAKYFPESDFYIAGMTKPNLDIPINVIFLGRLTKDELSKSFSLCQFYFQLTSYEGFGLALCEAMLCECVPIGSSVNIIPDIIGNSGFILNEKNVDQLVNLIENIKEEDNIRNLEKKARERIIKNYSSDRRKKLLLDFIANNTA